MAKNNNHINRKHILLRIYIYNKHILYIFKHVKAEGDQGGEKRTFRERRGERGDYLCHEILRYSKLLHNSLFIQCLLILLYQ